MHLRELTIIAKFSRFNFEDVVRPDKFLEKENSQIFQLKIRKIESLVEDAEDLCTFPPSPTCGKFDPMCMEIEACKKKALEA
ncbi:hypothetical protein M5K25_013436 [Dendrobium thyrsiflorum]|uniref:Uncharacterized protein n=1 Tax=Dendrobium thyrsiflorum TaxID=117978 RepID=A0ABD0USV5_DENTH